ncbi:MAG: alpha/beta hydrolase [Cyanobacteriota bacterium]|nr:alpha/beta hydrolase [Cyanobacteriota bacterium]
MAENFVSATQAQLDRARQQINAYLQSIDSNPDRRFGAYPYYLFHEAGTPIRGTVMLFHGFTARPHQMWRLADYLFQNGFNIYQAGLCGHTFLPPDKYWPQIDLKPEYANPLREKAQHDPVLMNVVGNIITAANATEPQSPNALQSAALLARLLEIEPKLLEIRKALEDYDDPDFDRYFTSSHTNYLHEARSRLTELDAMPGNIYTLGLSVGGAVALALAADRPDRIKKAIAYAPLLEIYGEQRALYVNLAGPLDIAETGWDPTLRFPVGCFTAVDRFGDFVLLDRNIQKLKQVPTLLVLTENEDAADIETNQNLFEKLGGKAAGHAFYLYPASDLVPHPMVDPREVSQGMSNQFWQSLYQESFRFLTDGKIVAENMSKLEQDSTVPIVPDV